MGELPELLAGASPRWFSVRGTLECVHVLATARWLGKERKKEAERKKNAEDQPEADFPVIYNLIDGGTSTLCPMPPAIQANLAQRGRGPGGGRQGQEGAWGRLSISGAGHQCRQ